MAKVIMNVNDDLLAKFDDLVKPSEYPNRTAYIVALMANEVEARTDLRILRWIDLEALPGRVGDFAPGEWGECPRCGQVIDRPFLPLLSNGMSGEVCCSLCGNSD